MSGGLAAESVITATPNAIKAKKTFDNNSYSIIRKELNKSPKMANYIQEVYDASGKS